MLASKNQGKWTLVDLSGTLDISNSVETKKQLVEGFIDKGKTNLALDLSNVPMVDSSGLGVFISLVRRCKTSGGDFALVCPNEKVEKLLKITGIDRSTTVLKNPSELR